MVWAKVPLAPSLLYPHATAGTGTTLSTGDPHVPEHHGTSETANGLQTQLSPGHSRGQRQWMEADTGKGHTETMMLRMIYEMEPKQQPHPLL